jgi:hypothetical protein
MLLATTAGCCAHFWSAASARAASTRFERGTGGATATPKIEPPATAKLATPVPGGAGLDAQVGQYVTPVAEENTQTAHVGAPHVAHV